MSKKNGKTMLSAALELLDQGLSVIPLQPRGKKPLIAWQEFQGRRPTEDEVAEWWEKTPDANIGLVCGAVSGVWVADGDGEIGSRWIAENFPRTSIYVQTGRECGSHSYFKIGKFKVKSINGFRPKVDIKGDGGYVVCPPSVHENGRKYEWIYRQGMEGWRDLPEFNPAKTGATTLNLDLSRIKAKGEPTMPAEKGGRNDALASFVGKLVRSGVGREDVLAAASGWNQSNRPPLGEKEVAAVVASVFKTHERNHPNDAPSIIMGAADVEDEAAEPLIIGPRTDTVPTEILQPGGILQSIMDYIEQASAASIPLFALGAATTTLGAILGQRVMTESGLRTNFYTISLGYSGSGKNAPISTIPQLLMASSAAILQGPTELASAAALQKTLAAQDRHSQLVMLDEVGMMLRGLKNPNSPLAEIPRVLTKLFSGTDRSERKTYADSKMDFTIPWHHLGVYGASTPDEFWSSLSEGDTTSGFLARFFILESRAPAPEPRTNIDSKPDPQLVDMVSELWAGLPWEFDASGGNIAVAKGDAKPRPRMVRKSQAAAELFAPFSKKYHDLKNDHRAKSNRSSIYARVGEHASKLALVHHMSKFGAGGACQDVEPASVEWAMRFAEMACARSLEGITDNVATTEWHGLEQRVIRIIRDRASQERPGLAKWEIQKAAGLPPARFNELLNGLILARVIRKFNWKPKTGRPTELFGVVSAHGQDGENGENNS